MDELHSAMRALLVESCRIAQTAPVRQRMWTTITRASDGGAIFDQHLTPDNVHAMFKAFTELLDSRVFGDLIDAASNYDPLANFILRDVRRYFTGINNLNQLGTQYIWNSFVGKFLTEYFDNGGLQFNSNIFDALFNKFIAELATTNVKHTRIFPLLGVNISVDEVIITPSLRIRRITNDELNQWFNPSTILDAPQLNGSLFLNMQCAIESFYFYDPVTRDGFPGASDIEYSLSHLIGLVVDTEVSIALIASKNDSMLYPSYAGTHWPASIHSPLNRAEINGQTANEIIELWQKIGQQSLVEQGKKNKKKGDVKIDIEQQRRIMMAIRRWSDGGLRVNIEDSIVDYWIALEALFLQGIKQELALRASILVAAFIGETSGAKLEIYHHLKDSYDIRSAIVHGSFSGNRAASQEVRQITRLTGGYLRLSLLKLIRADKKFQPKAVLDTLFTGT